jgi:hypothetical protein
MIIERMAKEMIKADGLDPDLIVTLQNPKRFEPVWKLCLESASIAYNMMLDEASFIAENRCGSPEWEEPTKSGYDCAAKEIAHTFRAMKVEI